MSRFPIPEWAADIDDAQFTDPAKVKTRAVKFERTIKRRNFIEYAAGALSFVLFGGLAIASAYKGEFFFAAPAALCVICVGVVLWQLNKRGSYQPSPPEETCLTHLRGQYERQYEALRTVPLWYLGPLALGIFSFYAAMIVQFTQLGGFAKALEGTWQPILGTAAFFGFVWWLNWFSAGKLKKQIDQIDALATD